MIIDNNTTCPNCDALLIKEESVCQSCGAQVKIDQREE